MPIGGVLISEPIYQVMLEQSRKIGTFGHGFTYSGHPVCAAVALRALEVYEEDGLLDHVRAVRRTLPPGSWNSRLIRWSGSRASGAVGAIELMADPAQKVPFEPAFKVGHAWSSTRSTMA